MTNRPKGLMRTLYVNDGKFKPELYERGLFCGDPKSINWYKPVAVEPAHKMASGLSIPSKMAALALQQIRGKVYTFKRLPILQTSFVFLDSHSIFQGTPF